MKYFEALKIYNQGRSSYCSPKKGTPEHAKVVAIQKGGGGGAAAKAKPSYADVISAPAPKKAAKAAKAKPSYADVISMPKPAKSAKPAIPSYADILTAPAPRKTYADVLSAPNDNPSYASVISSSMRSSNTSGMPLGQSMRGGGAAVISQSIPQEIPIATDYPVISQVVPPSPMPPMPSKERIAELKAKGRALIAQRKADAAAALAAAAPAGVLGKEAGKMINMALKGRLARKRMKAAEKEMLFDILLQDTPYVFKNVPKSDVF